MSNSRYLQWPFYSDEEVDAVTSVIRSGKVNYWTGEHGRLFEKEFADWCGAKHAIAVANGTVALDAILRAYSIGPGDEVIVTSRTFIASVSSIINTGARAVFADVDRDSQNITADSIRAVLTPNTKAIICVHLAGWPCDMDSIMALSTENEILVFEDCAQAHGAKYKGISVGSYGHAAAWSFCQDKIMSTLGEGGMVTTNSDEVFENIWSLKDHGKNYNTVFNKTHPPGFRWLHETFGTNWRLTEAQSAVGRIQLNKMEEWGEKRRKNRQILHDYLRPMPIIREINFPDTIVHACYKSYEFLELGRLKPGWDRERIIFEAGERGIPIYQGSCSEVYLEKAFDMPGARPSSRLPVAKELGDTSLMWLVHPTLTDQDMHEYGRLSAELLNDATA